MGITELQSQLFQILDYVLELTEGTHLRVHGFHVVRDFLACLRHLCKLLLALQQVAVFFHEDFLEASATLSQLMIEVRNHILDLRRFQ